MGAAASMMAFGELGTALGVADKITKASGWLQKLGQVGQTAGKINGKVVPWLLTNFLSANGEASIEAVNSVKDNEKSLSQNVEEFTKRRNQEIQEEYMADVVSGMDYNQAIARHNQRLSSLNAEVAMYRTAMQEELTKAGNLVYGMNVVALMLTNGINMGSFIKGGYKNASRIFDNAALKIGEKTGGIKDFTRKELSEAILRGTLEADAGEIKRGAAKVAGRWLINSAAEGMQEGLQSEISTTNEILTQSRLNRYAIENNLTDSYINPATTDKYIDLSTAALKAWDEQFGSISSPGWEEVFIGALSAGIGMPFGRVESTVRKDNTLQKRFKFGWQGGVAEAIEDVYGDKRKLQAMS